MVENLFRLADQEDLPSRRCVMVNGPVILRAGPSGLATAACLREREGVPSIVLEMADCIASLWQKRIYDRLKLHLPKQFCQLPMLPFPDNFLVYPSNRQFTEYLESYANKFQINPLFNECVQSVLYDQTIGLWRVKTVSGSTSSTRNEVEYISRWLVEATGENAVCVKPEIEGLSEFKGDVIHACDYMSGKSFRGKKVLVVGCGNSGMEISLDLCNHKALPSMVVCSSVSVEIDHICSQYKDATDLTDKKKNDVSGNSCRRKSEVGEQDTIRKSHGSDFILEPITVINHPEIESASMIWNMINSTYDGLASEQYPIRSREGEGGAYFMLDSTGQKKVSVFKPTDEEPKAVNNPRGRHPLSTDGEGLKKGTRVGQGAFMEVAAYALDHPISGRRRKLLISDEKGFAGVPPTLMVKCLHKGFNHPGDMTAKVGSMQMFVENDGSCEDFGPGVFPVKEVHKITVLDIRLANADRHAGNILFIRKKENDQSVMIPIDHGYCLPTCFEDCTFEWLYWPQARQQYSLEAVEYIKSLDAEEDIALLNCRVWDLPTEGARTLKISTMLLKKGVERGLTPFAIGSLMCRESLNKKSVIEEIVQVALDSVPPDTSEATLVDAVSQIMDQRLDELFNSL